jgi:hypothetical protein
MHKHQTHDTTSSSRHAKSTQRDPLQGKATPDKTGGADAKAGDKPYKLSPRERAAIAAFYAKYETSPPAPRMKVSEKNGVTEVGLDHPEPSVAYFLLAGALGASDFDFMYGILDQLENATTGEGVNEPQLNFMLSVIRGIKPSDQVEAMLAAQMAVVHTATMTYGRLLAKATCLLEIEGPERALPKLARTFAAQVEALHRYRSTGERKPRDQEVKHNATGQRGNGVQPTANGGGKANGHNHERAGDAP